MIQVIDQCIDGRGLCRIAGAVLQFLSVVEEEPAVVGPEGEPGNCATASSERTAEVVPPGLAKVEAVLQGRSCNCPVARVGGLETQRLVVLRRFEFGVKIGHKKVSL